ncbi:MAG TPA: acetate uptake transporter [Candidatus Bathyarchaeia archaeon]|jgi:succinate-acetate transporter protein|nr:acetate uptake transporter [Candidatus Bathyarchaeia archaeon]
MSEKLANAAPLGLLGFGITTVLLNFIHNFRLTPVDGVIIGMGLFYGGLAQVIAGIMEYKRGNTFGTVAFTSYGLFWWSFAFINTQSVIIYSYSSTTSESLMAYFFMWGLFTLCMFFGTLKKNRAIQFVFASLFILFFLLAAKFAILAYTSMISTDLNLFTQIIGIEGIICGLSAVYLAIAEILNEAEGRTVLPICPVAAQ